MVQHAQAEIAAREKGILMSIKHQFLVKPYSFFKVRINVHMPKVAVQIGTCEDNWILAD